MAGTPALLNVSRLNNFRLNAVDPVLVKQRENRVGILLNGQDVRGRVRIGTLTIRDSINDAPNSAAFTIEGPPRSAYVDAVLADHPIAYWRLGDTTATALDQTGHGHTGMVVGGVTINQPGAIADGDRSMHFPGISGARIEVPAAPELALTQSVTLEVWVKTDTVAQIGGMVEKTIGGAVNTSYSLFQINATWDWRVVIGGAAYDVSAPIDPADVGQWVHLVVGFVSGLMYIYKNGGLVAAITGPAGALDSGTGPLLLGHLGSGQYPFAGALDEVAVYPYLSGNSIVAHATIGRAVAAPTVAQEVRITLGVDDPVLLFNGAVSQVDLSYEGRALTPIYHCNATDDMARANRRRPFGQWTNVSASIVAQALIANFVPGFGSTFVQSGLPPITVIFDGSEGMNRCLTQITNLIGGYWYFSDRQLHLFRTEGTNPPSPIDASHPFLEEPHITANVDISQVRTRVYGRGHGEALLSAVVAGETLIPIASVVMFAATGGRAIALSQSLSYAGVYLGGIGSLIGPGAAPSVAPSVALLTGAGLATGLYQYAYTFATAAGESLAGPLATINVGLTAPPAVAGTVSPPKMGPGPDPGAHAYAVTFVTASGETTLGPSVAASTDVVPAPASAPSPRMITSSVPSSPESGTYDYVMTFVTDDGGETTASPVSNAVTVTNVPARYITGVPTPNLLDYGGNYPSHVDYQLNNSFSFVMTAHTAAGESTPSGASGSRVVHYGPNPPYLAGMDVRWGNVADAAVIGRSLYRLLGGVMQGRCSYVQSNNPNGQYDGAWAYAGSYDPAKKPPTTNGAFVPAQAQQQVIALSDLPRGDANVASRNLYRRFNGSGPFKLVATIANNTATTYTDTLPNASVGAAAPGGSTAYLRQLTLTALPIGDPLVTARKIYRTKANGSSYWLAATLADNTTKTWVDTLADAALGAAAPSTNTATANQVSLTAIAVGASAVTARKLYRTPVNGGALKLLATIPNNSTLTYVDAAPDASLGAAPPTSDTSGLGQPTGQVNAGSTSLPTASAGPFPTTGGWALIGTQAIRYTGISGNTLTGIPPTGPGALIATVRFGDHILSAPMLTGVSVPSGPLLAPEGTVVYIWIQRDDVPAQAAMARLDGGDGVYEYLVQDERRGEASLTALCDAHLTQYKAPIQTITYATRDLKTKSGKPVTIDLASPPILGSFVIQDVTIDQIDTSPGVAPRFVVTASTVRFSLEDLLRQLAGTLEVTPL